MMPVRQVAPHDHWPSGDSRPLAVLRSEPETLSERYGLTFTEDQDDLDALRFAAIALADGSQAWLMKYRSYPDPGTTVHVDATADMARTRALLIGAFDLRDDDFLWDSTRVEAESLHR